MLIEIDELIDKQYEEDNYRVEYNDCKNGLAYIYCSSNALYEKGNPDSFAKKVVEGDRYEWLNLRADCKPELEIFIRDIYLSWYVKGINSKVNSFEKLIKLMKHLTDGYSVRCVGASSGGFIGNILAMELNAPISFCFAGQFSLEHHFDHLQKNLYLKEYNLQYGNKYLEYYKDIPNTKVKILYMYPCQSKQDQEQYELVKGMNSILTIGVKCSEHGVAIYPFAIPRYLSYTFYDAKKLVGGAENTRSWLLQLK